MDEIVEGRNPVLELLKAGRPVNKVLLANDAERHGVIAQILYLARRANVPVEYVDKRVIDQRSSTGHAQGVLVYTSAKEYVGLEDLLQISRRRKEPPLYVILDGIEDPHNLGAVLRTADATGVHGVIIPTRRAVGLTAAVARASAGAVEYVAVARVTNITQTIKQLAKEQVWVVGIDMDGKQEYTGVDYKLPTAIVIGAEGEGLSRLVKESCDSLVSIPMKGKVGSLNASVAAAVVMYETLRQRRPPVAVEQKAKAR